MRQLLLASAFLLAGAVSALAQTLTNPVPLVGTVQGRILAGSGTSTLFNAANTTMAPNSVPFPTGNLGTLNFVNESTGGSAFLCIAGGTATSTAGCTIIAPGAAIEVTFPNPGANQKVPSFYSANGAYIDFWN